MPIVYSSSILSIPKRVIKCPNVDNNETCCYRNLNEPDKKIILMVSDFHRAQKYHFHFGKLSKKKNERRKERMKEKVFNNFRQLFHISLLYARSISKFSFVPNVINWTCKSIYHFLLSVNVYRCDEPRRNKS